MRKSKRIVMRLRECILKLLGVFLTAGICPLLAMVMASIIEEDKIEKNSKTSQGLVKELKMVFVHITSPTTFKVMAYLFFANAMSPQFGQVFYFYVTEELKFSNDFLSLSFAGTKTITANGSKPKCYRDIKCSCSCI